MSQENLDKRVSKAKKLRFTPVPGIDREWNTWGSKDDHYVVGLDAREIKIYPTTGASFITAFFT